MQTVKDKLNRLAGGGIVKRFIIFTVVIIIILDILTAIFMQADQNRILSDELNERGELLSRHLAAEINGTLLNEDNQNASQLVENIKISHPDVEYVYVTDAGNNIIAHTSGQDFPGDYPPAADRNVVDFKIPTAGGGFAHVLMDKTQINEKIIRATHIAAVNILIEGALGFLMAYIAGNYLTRPIRSLVKGAQEIGKGNLGYKIETGSTDDEIVTLSNAFNQMSQDLNTNIGELKKLSTAVEEAPDGIQIVDLEGRIVYSNKAIEKIYGFTPDELAGKHVNEMNVDPDFAGSVILPGLRQTGKWVGEIMVKHKNGRDFPVWLNASMVRGSRGEPIAMVGIIRDLTEQKEIEKLELQLLQADKLATIGQLAAGVAHEINNPLGNISLYTQMLLKKTEDENSRDKLNIIGSEANRAARIVKDLLDFARQSELELGPVDINNEIGKVLSILHPNLKDIRVTTELGNLPSVLADGGQIEQAIMNILTNSIQSITENGEITVRTEAKENHVEISISDNGCGIPQENLDKIFDPFFTTKEPGKGTGLGLSISYGIIKRHKGSIDVKSEVGKGTTVMIKLPD